MNVPFVDLKRQYTLLKKDIDSGIQGVLDSTRFILGENGAALEEEFSRYCGIGYTVGLASGTDALILALEALGIGPGDEVITVPSTFVATVAAIGAVGAKTVLVDIDQTSYTMDPAKLKAAISSRTKAILPVQLYGQMADMDPIMDVARTRGIPVVEDAAQAHGSLYKGKKAGTFGKLGCFSFYPGKNLGAYGDAGAVVTSDSSLATKIKQLRDHGKVDKDHHDMPGHNSRLDEIQAAILRVKLRHLDAWNEQRRKAASLYNALLGDMNDIVTPREMAYGRHVYHLYVIQSRHRDDLQSFLLSKGVNTGIHYRLPVHLQKGFKGLGYKEGDFPIAETFASRILSLPMFPEITEDECRWVAHCIREYSGNQVSAKN